MKTKIQILALLLVGCYLTSFGQKNSFGEKSHDLSLPQWGPYTKNYIGISHIPDLDEGIRFDLSIFPGFYRRKVSVPNVMYESGYHPWEASQNLKYFSYRHELEWKDKVYTDVSYSYIDEKSRLIRMECVNNTEYAQSIVMHLMGSIHFPSVGPYRPDTPIKLQEFSAPEEVVYVDGLDYTALNLVKKSPRYSLVYDGKMRGEVRTHNFINGSAVKFGSSANDEALYSFTSNSTANSTIWIRYKAKAETKIKLICNNETKEVTLKSTGDKTGTQTFDISGIKTGENKLKFLTSEKNEVLIDGFALGTKPAIDKIEVSALQWVFKPKIEKGPIHNSILLKYKNLDTYYGIMWQGGKTEVREWNYRYLSEEFMRKINAHTQRVFGGSKDGHYTNIFIRPINVDANSTKVLNGFVCTGSRQEVEKALKEYSNFNKAENHYAEAKRLLPDFECNKAGEKYLFSQQRMFANTVQNVVYPVYTQKQYIRHHAPGRWWDSLYTWDSGFIGIGLAQYSQTRGEENLEAYLNSSDEQSAFIHHGTPLPVQHYLYQELWNQYQSREMLERNYEKLKNYYNFLSGKAVGSSTRTPINMIKTWDYFYNSGGWDDYPPQKHVHSRGLRGNTSPVVSTAHAIRIAKILRMTADYLKLKSDSKKYQKDINAMAKALNTYSWDEASGYYGYVTESKNEAPKIMRYKSGENFNMGLGGASPIIAGVCNQNQIDKIINHLKTKGEIWSDVGLSAVDQTAPYYKNDGYWNGTVWMPHQWFFWKSMLDYGETDFAFKIAKTALEVWKKETDDTYNCFEHFVIESGRGAGWHQFSGLSAAVLSWFTAYYKPGTLTTGYDVFISNKKFSEDNSSLSAKLQLYNNNQAGVVAVMNENFEYEVLWNNKPIEFTTLSKGCLTFKLPLKSKKGNLEIVRK